MIPWNQQENYRIQKQHGESNHNIMNSKSILITPLIRVIKSLLKLASSSGDHQDTLPPSPWPLLHLLAAVVVFHFTRWSWCPEWYLFCETRVKWKMAKCITIWTRNIKLKYALSTKVKGSKIEISIIFCTCEIYEVIRQ